MPIEKHSLLSDQRTAATMDLLDWLLRLVDVGGAQLGHLAPIYTADGGVLPPERD